MGERGTDIGAFEGALGGADFDEFGVGEEDRAGAVQSAGLGVWMGVGVNILGVAGLMDGLEDQLCNKYKVVGTALTVNMLGRWKRRDGFEVGMLERTEQ